MMPKACVFCDVQLAAILAGAPGVMATSSITRMGGRKVQRVHLDRLPDSAKNLLVSWGLVIADIKAPYSAACSGQLPRWLPEEAMRIARHHDRGAHDLAMPRPGRPFRFLMDTTGLRSCPGGGLTR